MNTGRPSAPVLSWALVTLLATLPAGAATLTVNSLSDDTTAGNGLVTLREAVTAANGDSATDLGQSGSGADTIVFDASLAGGTIQLATAAHTAFGPSALAITSEVTIDGAAAPLLRIARDPSVQRLRQFYVAAGATLRLRNVTIAGGVARGFAGGATHRGGSGGGGAGLGGAIFNEGTLDLTAATLDGNQAAGGVGGPQSTLTDLFPRAGSGGGGTAGDGGVPTGGPTPFDVGGAGGAGGGGAGGNGGDSSCTAGSSGAFGGGGGGGGGCANNPACNAAAGGFGGGGGGGGGGQTGQAAGTGGAGGFGAGNGGNGVNNGTVTSPGGGGGGGAGLGGAVFNHGGTVTITNSTFSANEAHGGAGGRNGAAGQGLGGAVFNRNGTLTVLATTFAGNVGGAVYNLGDAGTAAATINGSILADSTGGNDFTGNSIAGGSQSAIGTDNLMESQSGFTGSIASSADPQLAALAANGGPTETHLPALTSPALEASNLATPATDQRGTARPQGAKRDIGSVEVVYNQPPVAVCQNVTVNAGASCTASVSATAIGGGSYDPDSDPITLSVSPAGPYSLGQTVVTLTVTDDGGLTDSCQATVTVVDATAPVISCPADVTVECPASTAPSATGTATASDNCTTSPVVAYTDAVVDGCGGTVTITRTWTATDAAGNSSSCTQTVKTVDTTPPTITPGSNNTACLWPPNGKYVYFDHVSAAVQVTDACDDAPTVSSVSCVSSQCDDAPCPEHPGENGDGSTTGDCLYDPLLDRLAVRAERAGTDPAGRTYSLILTAQDACGNHSASVVVFTVKVPFAAVPGQQCLKP